MNAEASISPEIFKQTMGLLAGGVCIAASAQDGERQGLTVSAVCSLTLDPPTLVLCVNQSAGAHDMMCATKKVSINFLTSDQLELAALFSSSKVKGDQRFEISNWTNLPSGIPGADGALAALDCEIINEMKVGQHSVFACEIKHARLNTEKSSLVYFNRAFCEVAPLDKLPG